MNSQLTVRDEIKKQDSKLMMMVQNDEAKASAFKTSIYNLSLESGLKDCSPESIVSSAMRIVNLGLNPDKLYGHGFVVPRTIKQGNQFIKVASFQLGYKGVTLLLGRAGVEIRTHIVYSCDKFKYKIKNDFNPSVDFVPNFEERDTDNVQWIKDNIIGVLVYSRKDKKTRVDYVTNAKIEKLRLSSPNQQSKYDYQTKSKVELDKNKYHNVWSEWAEEMIQGKAVKYIGSRLPIDDKVIVQIKSDETEELLELKEEVKQLKQQSKSVLEQDLLENIEVSPTNENQGGQK